MNDSLVSSTILQRKTPTSTKWLPKPGERRPMEKLICVYGRYSTPEQKARSIDRQESRCRDDYIKPVLGGQDYLLFADRGYSGCLLKDRPDLMALLELVKTRTVTDIVIEAFDRLSRDIWDSMRIGELLEVYGVKLHVWNLGRAVSRQELVGEAKRAEADRKRRWEVLSDGLYQLIRDGGMPGQKNFGYKVGERRGFPVVCEVARKAVERVFELAKFKSDRKVAVQLSSEGFTSPNGTTRWTVHHVARIRSNVIYIGVINFRTTNQEAQRVLDDDIPTEPGEIAVRTKIVKSRAGRSAAEWVVGYNSRYQIVSDEDFLAVAMARGRPRRAESAGKRPTVPVEDPFGNPICDCSGRSPNQKFYLRWDAVSSYYYCSLDHENKGCLCRVGHHQIAVVDVQRVVVASLRKHALPLCGDSDFRADFLDRIRVRGAEDEIKRTRLIVERDDLDRQINNLLEDGTKSGFDPERVRGRVAELEDDLKRKKLDIARVQKIDPETADIEGAVSSLSDAFAVVGDRLPFKPQDKNEDAVATRLRSMISRVVVRREAMPIGRAEIEIALDVEGYVLGRQGNSEGSYLIERKEIRGTRRFRTGGKTRAELDELAASGLYDVTDAQWEMVAPLLPDMSLPFGRVGIVMPTRQVANAAIFKFRTGVDVLRLPPVFGEPAAIRTLIKRFVSAGGMAQLVKTLGVADPSWPIGLNVNDAQLLQSTFLDKQPWMVGDSGALATKWAAEKRFCITDEQYQAIDHLIDPSVLKPQRAPQTLDARQLIDGILLKLHSGAAWKRMPPPWGRYSDLRRAAAALALAGAWGQIVAIWRDRFPTIVDGLALDIIDRLGASYDRDLRAKDSNRKRGARNARGLFANFATLLRTATAGAGVAVCLNGARVRLPDHKYLRPDLIVGPEKSIIGSIVTQPAIVVQRTPWSRHAWNTRQVQRFRGVRGVKHILLVSTDRMHIDHYEKKDGKWTTRVLGEGDAVSIMEMDTLLSMREIYAGAEF